MKLFHAYCFQTGEIEICSKVPDGVIVIADSYFEKRLKNFIEVNARHAYDGKTLLVPGIQEQTDERCKLNALSEWLKVLKGKEGEFIEVGTLSQDRSDEQCLSLCNKWESYS